MADMMEVSRLKNSKVLVEVVEALEDLLVVSFKYQERTGSTQHFQGVLLNSKKKNWPLGVITPSVIPFPGTDGESLEKPSNDHVANCSNVPAASIMMTPHEQQQLPVALDSDRLYAVRRRHTYFQGTAGGGGSAGCVGGGTAGTSPSIMCSRRSTYSRRFGDKTTRTMRLRPRQVLCSKCKSICNENSENVQVANAFKRAGELNHGGGGVEVVQSHGRSSCESRPEIEKHERLTLGPSKLDGLLCGPATLTDGRMVLRKRRIQNDVAALGLHPPLPPPPPPPSLASSPHPSLLQSTENPAPATGETDAPSTCAATTTMTTTTKRLRESDNQNASDDVSVLRGSTNVTAEQQVLKQKKTSPFIKISFGPQGTVIKIPPRTHTYIASDNESDLQDIAPESGSSPAYRHFRAKAAKKALKKAKKDAQKVKVASFTNSPLRQDSSIFETHKSRHHKHKFKHKRKHREDVVDGDSLVGDVVRLTNDQIEEPLAKLRENDDDHNVDNVQSKEIVTFRDDRNGVRDANRHGKHSVVENGDGELVIDRWDLETSNGHRTDAYSKIKKECLRQKLSISLKRLSEKSYMKCSPTYNNNNNNNNNHDDSNGGGGNSNGNGEGSNDSSEAGDLPEFPEISEPPKDPTMRPLMMRISSYNVSSFSLADGRIISTGDVVWGKIHGFPWWPGKVLSISVSQRDNGLLVTQQAHVAWFGSSTSSQMPCNQLVPFLEDFKLRYNKKKRGPYKEAIKQATLAAQQVLRSVRMDT